MNPTIADLSLPTLILSAILISIYIVFVFRKNNLHNSDFWINVLNKSVLLYGLSVVVGIIAGGIITLYVPPIDTMIKQLYTPIGIGTYMLKMHVLVFLFLIILVKAIKLEHLCNKNFYVKDYKYTSSVLSVVLRAFALLLQASISVFLAYLLYNFSWIDFSTFESLGYVLLQILADIIIVLGFLNIPINMMKCKTKRLIILKHFISTLMCYILVHFVLNIAQGENIYDILFHDEGVLQVSPRYALMNWMVILLPMLVLYVVSVCIKSRANKQMVQEK